jgi:hypothetical protein
MIEVRMKFREHGSHVADLKAQGRYWTPEATAVSLEMWNSIAAAEPGDVFRIRWSVTDAVAGYAICCVRCKKVHYWTSALNCALRKPEGLGLGFCGHDGIGSCWVWTGSAEENNLTASPSLHSVLDRDGCGFHGWLQNGRLWEP